MNWKCLRLCVTEFEIISRKEAKEKGLRFYFTGVPCCHGHLAKRFVNNGNCADCRTSELRRKEDLQSKYGMTIEDWDRLFEAQGYKCAICGSSTTKGSNQFSKNFWHTDHRHFPNQKKGKVRGILCHSCNIMMGHYEKALLMLPEITAYLDRTKTDPIGV